MKEIEVKARCENFESIKQKLVALGCTFSSVLVQEDSIYLPVPFEFGDIRHGMPVVRIRNSNGVCTLNLKKRLGEGLVKREHEVIINDPSECDQMLGHMDFHEVSHISKKRETCHYQDMEICLDEVTGLGSFIEAEVLLPDNEEQGQIEEKLFQFLLSLGIQKQDRVFQGYDEMLYQNTRS